MLFSLACLLEVDFFILGLADKVQGLFFASSHLKLSTLACYCPVAKNLISCCVFLVIAIWFWVLPELWCLLTIAADVSMACLVAQTV